MHFNWLDSFNVAIFKLRSSSVNEVLRGARKIWVKIRWGQGCNDIQHTIGAYKFRLVPQAQKKDINLKSIFRLTSFDVLLNQGIEIILELQVMDVWLEISGSNQNEEKSNSAISYWIRRNATHWKFFAIQSVASNGKTLYKSNRKNTHPTYVRRRTGIEQ